MPKRRSRNARLALTELPASEFPAYGYMHEGLERELHDAPFPKEFRINGQMPTADAYAAWLESLVDELASFLWPRYRSGTWVGAAAATALDMTLADLDLLKKLRFNIDQPIASRQTTTLTHRTLFEEEDTGKPGQRFDKYDQTAPADLVEKLPDAILDAGLMASSISLGLKQRLQRPRPYQVSFNRAIPYTYLLATTAVTPSMVSGHCLEGSMAAAGTYVALKADIDVVPGAADYLQQYLIDIGDRRVFAGVHYPTDNIGSWFCDLRMCENVFGASAGIAKRFLWDAITKHSVVFAAFRDAANTNAIYGAILDRLQAEALRPPS
jgi:hypothetical protein